MLGLVLILHIIIAVAVIALVLLQHGKGADMGASFGSGSSATLFGSRGAAPFMMKLTGFLAALFFITALTLGHLSSLQANAALELPQAPQKTVTTNQENTKKDVDALINHSNSDTDLINKIQEQSSPSKSN